jgi:uncharacterized membrane-anchored protein YitT (DUF2179 family)
LLIVIVFFLSNKEGLIMKAKDLLAGFGGWRRVIYNLFLITVGCVLCAVAVNGLLVPHDFVSGGLVGVALLVHYSWPNLSLALMLLIMNAVVFLIGWRFVGTRFLLYSLAGTFIFIFAIAYININIPVGDKMLAAILAGIITGAGAGLILRSQGSAGGIDILAVIMMENYSIRLGSTYLLFNSVVLVAAALIVSLQGALYTLVFMFVTSQCTDLVVTGLSKRKVIHIISTEWEKVSRYIQEEVKKGVTIIPAKGGYSGYEKPIIYTVVTFRDVARLKRSIRDIDPDAFMVINDTLEVVGAGMGSAPQWSTEKASPAKLSME